MKKWLACILACLAVCAFSVACNGKDGNSGLWENKGDSSSKGGLETNPPEDDDGNWTGWY